MVGFCLRVVVCVLDCHVVGMSGICCVVVSVVEGVVWLIVLVVGRVGVCDGGLIVVDGVVVWGCGYGFWLCGL